MARLPSLAAPSFDIEPFANTVFEVWSQADSLREREPILRVMPNSTYLYDDVRVLLHKHDATFAALLTAWNPGHKATNEFNAQANKQLLEQLNASGLAVYPARGTSTSGDWFEDSYLVVGGTYDQYVEWQTSFKQLAFVLFRTDGSVWLRW